MERIPILKMGDLLLVTIQVDISCGLRLPTQARRVVGESGAVPEQVAGDIRPGAEVWKPVLTLRVDQQIQPVGMTVSSAQGAALEADIAVAAPQNGKTLTLQKRAPGRPGRSLLRNRRQHLQQRPPGEIGSGARMEWSRLPSLLQVGIEGLG